MGELVELGKCPLRQISREYIIGDPYVTLAEQKIKIACQPRQPRKLRNAQWFQKRLSDVRTLCVRDVNFLVRFECVVIVGQEAADPENIGRVVIVFAITADEAEEGQKEKGG